MKRRFFTTTVAVLLNLFATATYAAPVGDYVISPELSTATFTVFKWVVLKEQGRFNDVTGRVHYDPARPQDSAVDVSISTQSLDTNDAGRDRVLRSDDFFDVQRYPTMRFVSRRV